MSLESNRHRFEKIKHFECREPKTDAINLNSDSNNNSNYLKKFLFYNGLELIYNTVLVIINNNILQNSSKDD